MENRTKVKIIIATIGTIVIISGSVSLSSELTRHPDASYTDYITWSIMSSGIGLCILYTMLYMWKKQS